MSRIATVFARLFFSGFCLIAAAVGAQAADYPNRPVRIVVGYPPGGATDIVARIFGAYLSEKLGQQFSI